MREALANHARFRALVEEYVQVMEAHSKQAREQADDLGRKKKPQAEITALAGAELTPVVTALLQRDATVDEAEATIRAALSRSGAAALQAFMQAQVDRADGQRPTPRGMQREGRRPVWVRSAWGDFQLYRAYYRAIGGGNGWTPADAQIGTWESYTPALARIASRLAATMPFAPAADLLALTTGATLDARQFQRFVVASAPTLAAWLNRQRPTAEAPGTLYISYDGTGVPMRKECLAGHQGKTPGEPAKTREMRLASVFTQSTLDERGHAIRDPNATTYVADLASVEQFGPQVRAEAERRGLALARRVVILTDGAAWCETVADNHFPRATRILDFYHAAEHVHRLAKALHGNAPDLPERSAAWRHDLLAGKAADIVDAAANRRDQACDREALDVELGYLQNNLKRMHYDRYRNDGLFIGSGVIEAGCKTVVGQRTKLSGMHWGETGLLAVLAFRCALLSDRLHRFWHECFAHAKSA